MRRPMAITRVWFASSSTTRTLGTNRMVIAEVFGTEPGFPSSGARSVPAAFPRNLHARKGWRR